MKIKSCPISDLKWLCKFIEDHAEEKGLDVNDRSPQNVARMFQVIQEDLRIDSRRGSVVRWRTVVKHLRLRKKQVQESGV